MTTGRTARATLSGAGGSWSGSWPPFPLCPSLWARQRRDSSVDLLCASRVLWPWGFWEPRSSCWGWTWPFVASAFVPRAQHLNVSVRVGRVPFDLPPWFQCESEGLSSSEPCCRLSPNSWIVKSSLKLCFLKNKCLSEGKKPHNSFPSRSSNIKIC